MIRCLICNQSYSRRDALQRHECNVHGNGKYTDQSQPLKKMTFQHPFSMMITGPSRSGKTEWTRKLLLSSLVQSRPLAGYGLPPPWGNFVDHIFLKAQCLARILQHVSPLTMAALSCNSLLHTLPYKIFDN